MNVILDIGNVICEWNPARLVARLFSQPDEQRQALDAIIRHDEWLDLDRGTMALADAIENACQRCKLPRERVEAVYRETPAALVPIPSMITAIRDLSEHGVPLYVLSNMQRHSWDHLAASHEFWRHFRGIVVSCEIHLLKPEPEIYRYICDRHRLVPKETLFLDDSLENIDGARAFGLNAIHVPAPETGAPLLYRALGHTGPVSALTADSIAQNNSRKPAITAAMEWLEGSTVQSD